MRMAAMRVHDKNLAVRIRSVRFRFACQNDAAVGGGREERGRGAPALRRVFLAPLGPGSPQNPRQVLIHCHFLPSLHVAAGFQARAMPCPAGCPPQLVPGCRRRWSDGEGGTGAVPGAARRLLLSSRTLKHLLASLLRLQFKGRGNSTPSVSSFLFRQQQTLKRRLVNSSCVRLSTRSDCELWGSREPSSPTRPSWSLAPQSPRPVTLIPLGSEPREPRRTREEPLEVAGEEGQSWQMAVTGPSRAAALLLLTRHTGWKQRPV
nr:uncharacterized protein LOC110355183 [Columba livia]